VADGENSFWSFCVEYLDGAGAGALLPGGRPKIDYKEVLKPAQFEVFSRLREWRKGVAEKEGVPDFVVWGKSSADLRGVWRAVDAFLAAELRLVLKPNISLNRTAFGMDFLGYRVFPQALRLARRRKLRFARKFRRYEGEWVAGRWTKLQLQQRMQALVAFTLPARSRPWRRHVLHRFGVGANGLEPRDPRRQLEQLEPRRQELPVSEPQQQQPGQQEQRACSLFSVDLGLGEAPFGAAGL
jgi:hypothetical protein